jgi:hypothetical protein
MADRRGGGGDGDSVALVAVYAIGNGNQTGWLTGRTLGLLAVSCVLLVIFLGSRRGRARHLCRYTFSVFATSPSPNVIGVLWAGAMFAWFFLTALYLQPVLGYSPLQVGFAFLPGNLIMGAVSIGLSAKLVLRFGIRPPLSAGLLAPALGLLLLARAPVQGAFAVDVLPSMILLGLGAGTAFNPVLLAAMGDVEPAEASLASGLVNTSFMMGGALGLAALLSHRESPAAALTGGYHAAFLAGAIAAAAAALSAALLRAPTPQTTGEPAEITRQPAKATGEPARCTAFSVRDCRPAEQPG